MWGRHTLLSSPGASLKAAGELASPPLPSTFSPQSGPKVFAAGAACASEGLELATLRVSPCPVAVVEAIHGPVMDSAGGWEKSADWNCGESSTSALSHLCEFMFL